MVQCAKLPCMATKNTLIVYASRLGNAEKCAREIFHRLDGKVDICNLTQRKTFPDVSTYDSVIIGGSVCRGKIQEAVSLFCYDKIDQLTGKRLGFFITSRSSGEKAEKELEDAFPEELYREAIASEYFGKGNDTPGISFLKKLLSCQLTEAGEPVPSVSQEKIKRFTDKMNPSDAS